MVDWSGIVESVAGVLGGGKREWGVKGVAVGGVWGYAVQYGSLQIEVAAPVYILAAMSIAIIFANKIYNDFVRPHSPKEN